MCQDHYPSWCGLSFYPWFVCLRVRPAGKKRCGSICSAVPWQDHITLAVILFGMAGAHFCVRASISDPQHIALKLFLIAIYCGKMNDSMSRESFLLAPHIVGEFQSAWQQFDLFFFTQTYQDDNGIEPVHFLWGV